MHKSPTNKKEYWDLIETHWEDINRILNIYLPTFQNKWIDGSVLDKSLGEYIQDLKDAKNPRIIRVFNSAWWAAPDDIGIWDHKGWGVLCDLCSEEYVLHEEREE